MAPGGLRSRGSHLVNANNSDATNSVIAPGGLRSRVNRTIVNSQRMFDSQCMSPSQRVPNSQPMPDSQCIVGSQRASNSQHEFGNQRVTGSQHISNSQSVPSSQRVTSSQPTSANTGNDTNSGPTQACLEEKKGRKKAQNNSLNDFIGGGGGKPKIVIPIGKKRPLGKWSSEWVTEMGIIVFQNIQLTKHYWKDLTYEDKIPLYNKVTLKFDVDMSLEHVREAVDSSLRDRFKARRHNMYQYYMSIPEGENKFDYPEKTVTQIEWESLCAHFESEDFKRSSERNKSNRAKPRVNHRGGCKSFVRHRFDQRDPETGKEPDVVDFYRNMRWNNKKGWIAPEAEENYEKMLEIRSQPVEDGDIELTDAQIVEKVLGKRSGYVMTLGHGEVLPSRKSRVAYNEEELKQLRIRAEEQDQELNELRAWKASQEELINSQQQMIAAQAKKQEETDLFLNALKEKFGL